MRRQLEKENNMQGFQQKNHFIKCPLIPFPKLLPQPCLGKNNFGGSEKKQQQKQECHLHNVKHVTLLTIFKLIIHLGTY